MSKNKKPSKKHKKTTNNKSSPNLVVTYPSYKDNGSYIVNDRYIRVTSK